MLVTRKDHALTNHFLPGYWPHAMLYLCQAAALEQLGITDHDNSRRRWSRLVGLYPAEPRRVLEAQKDGVQLRSLDACFGCTYVAVIRPRLSQGDIAVALARALLHEGKPYDFDFTRSDRLVCTEVLCRAYEGIVGIAFELTRRAGRMTLGA